MSDAPEKIWLQIGDNERCTYSGAIEAGAEISWCQEPAYEFDIEYTRSDISRLKPETLKDIETVTQCDLSEVSLYFWARAAEAVLKSILVEVSE